MRHILLATLAAAVFASAAQAAPNSGGQEAMLGLYAGQFAALRDYDNSTAMVGAEYRYKDVWRGIRPTAGAFGTEKGEMYAYAGINWDLPLNIAPIYITPGFNAGYYRDNDKKELGYALEFRSTLEATYQFENHERVGLAISHLSNAGLGNRNPGVETIQAIFALPL